MSKLDRLLSVRKRALGDFDHHIMEMKKFTTDSNTTEVSFRVIAMEKAFKEFVDTNDDLERLATFHELEQVDVVSTENRKVQDKYLQIKLHIATILPTDEHTLNASFFPTGSREETEDSTRITSQRNSGIKMPTIQVTPFDGDFEKWPEFRDMFRSLMNKYQGDGVEKLTHLKNYLRGPALDAIRHLSLENANYEAAWDELILTFENKNAIIDANLRKFLDIPIITASATSVRHALSTTRSCLSVIQRFAIVVDTWDPMIVFMLKDKLCPELRAKWEEERKGSNEPATLKAFYCFLEVRLKVLLSMPTRKIFQKPLMNDKNRVVKTFTITKDTSLGEEITPENESEASSIVGADDTDALFLVNRKGEKCTICSDELHRAYQCPKLRGTPEENLKLVQGKNLCTNCLYKHETSACLSKFTCKTCQQSHNTVLHDAFHTVQIFKIDTTSQPSSQRALLATAMIPIQTNQGQILLRALIDQGSTANLLSERGAQLIHSTRQKILEVPMYGVGEIQTGTANAKTSFVIGSLYDKAFALSIDAYIAKRITAIRPITAEITSTWVHLNGLQLADPTYFANKAIDILIGTRTFAEIIESGLIKGQPNEPIGQKTKLGWITSGAYEVETTSELLHCLHALDGEDIITINTITDDKLSDQMKAFWEIEETPINPIRSESELECENFFVKTVSRGDDGKLVMRLPFNDDSKAEDFLGESFERAKHRFFQLERRFARDPSLKEKYAKCIEEYITLKHAREVPMGQFGYVIPHHAVLKESSTTTQLRVVYDASAKTSNNYSLNDRLHIGPTILEELWSVLIRWRMGKIALTADIEKMYRQFWVHSEDTKFQQILWRNDPSEPLKLYELQTVTFGTSPAPYLAIRGLHFIAESIEEEQPKIAKVIKKNFYVDDCQPSVDTIEEAIELKTQLSDVFSSFGMNLRKWNSNAIELLTEEVVNVKTHPHNMCTALGLQWNASTDDLSFKITLKKEAIKITKRVALSEIASLFDPLGLLAPMIMRAKVFLQKLWLGTFGWDDELPEPLKQEWNIIRAGLLRCSTMKVPRWIGYNSRAIHISLHGFSDASLSAYAAVLYLRTLLENGTIEVHLVTAKTKIAPLKSFTIHHLELCAAVLLAKLIDKFTSAIDIANMKVCAWTDSAPTLAWISTPPYKLKTFVSHRVAEIQAKVKPERWRYVKSTLNPADYATREQFSTEIVSLTQWWNGPSFLLEPPEKWPTTPAHMISNKKVPEMRKIFLHQQEEQLIINPLLTKYSSLIKLLRITAYISRWLIRNRDQRTKQVVTAHEIVQAKLIWIRHVQQTEFAKEMECLREKKSLPIRSPLLSLNPFLDENGILRVRGRLRNSLLPHNAKYPAILPAGGYFTTLIIRQAHFKALHGGLQLTLNIIREEFWIIRGKETVKRRLTKCMTCFRDRCRPAQQQMADLLPPQVQPNRPFSFTGVDFAGFFEVKLSTKRNAGVTKCYIALFVCLTTKAIHLELAHDLSTQAFISVLNRFISRRGIPNEMFSDRGTNFIGTANELPQLWYQETSPESQLIQQACTNHGITWHFNPARASHFGGIWEAGVKSVKTHLHRILDNTKLTYEDFNTVIIQIEACLNSRPLCPLSDNPDDLEALTPGHFLIGQALVTLPHPGVEHISTNRLSRYQVLQRMVQSFWTYWSQEYLVRLQQRPKWKQAKTNLGVNQLVVIKEDNMPPSKWVLGRILKTFPGKDNLVRSVEVKCKNTVVTRPIHKLCPLPIRDNLEENMSA